MKTNLFTTVSKTAVLVSLLFYNSLFSQEAYQTQLNTIFKTFITKDFQLLKPLMQQHKINSFQKNSVSKESLMVQQIGLVPTPESYSVIKSETIGYNERLTVQYQYADKLRTHYFTFDRKGRLISIEIRRNGDHQKMQQYSLL